MVIERPEPIYFRGSRLATGIDTSGRDRGKTLSPSRRTVRDV
jgi:hypothetical protein